LSIYVTRRSRLERLVHREARCMTDGEVDEEIKGAIGADD
jgi:hypothetical protein